jgi:hypothetical protein
MVYCEEVLKIQLWGACVAVMLCIFAPRRLDGITDRSHNTLPCSTRNTRVNDMSLFDETHNLTHAGNASAMVYRTSFLHRIPHHSHGQAG